MNVTVNAQALALEVKLLSKIAATKPSLPILSHILLRAEDQLYLTATNIEISMSTTCAGTVSEMGLLTLPAATLLELLDKLPEGDVTISDDAIVAGGFRSKLGSLPAADFPPMPDVEGEPVSFKAASLQSLIERTSYAISQKAQKYVLDGALLSLTGEVMAMVATDGKRLSVATAARPAGPDHAVVLPSKTMDVLHAQAPLGDVAFSRGNRHLFFQYGRRLIVSQMMDGEFPKYQRIIPKANNTVLAMSRGGLTAALKRVGLVSEIVMFHFTPGNLVLSGKSAEVGNAQEVLQVPYDGPEMILHTGWRYIVEFLEHATEANVSMALKDSTTPMLLTDGVDFINVVMLMKV